MKLAKTIRKVGVVSGVCDGFIGNRMLEEYLRQAYFLVEEGALPQQVDKALQDWGLAMGPFAMMDMAGQDIGWHVRKRRRAEDPERQIYPAWLDRICELGRFGQKTGKGVYQYPPGSRTPVPDPEIERLIVDYSKEVGVERRAVGDQEIVERCVYALVERGREDPRGRHRAPRERHRHGVPDRLRIPALPRRADVLRRHRRPRNASPPRWRSTQRGETGSSGSPPDCSPASPPRAGHSIEPNRRGWRRVEGESHDRSSDRIDRPHARSCKSWRGAFNMTHGATMGGHVVKHAIARAKLDPAEVEDVIMGCANPEGATGWNIARQIAIRAGCPVTTSGMTVNRFCSSGLQTIAMAAQRILAGEGEIYVAGGVESISCVQNEMNKHMFTEDWLMQHKPEIYWPMLQTAENVAQALQDPPRGAGPVRRAEPAPRRGRARSRQVQRRDRADHREDEGGRQEDRRRVDQGSHGDPGRGHPPRHHLRRACRRSSPRSRAA